MSEAQLTERLDQAIEAMLRQPDAELPTNSQLAGLLEISAALRALPRADFKARLRSEFEIEAEIEVEEEETSKSPVREGFRTVTPYLTVPDVFAEIEFLKTA